MLSYKSLINLSNMQEEKPNNTNQNNQAYSNMGDLFNESKLHHPIKEIKVILRNRNLNIKGKRCIDTSILAG